MPLNISHIMLIISEILSVLKSLSSKLVKAFQNLPFEIKIFVFFLEGILSIIDQCSAVFNQQ